MKNEFGLTPKQEAFAQAFVDLGVASQAYRSAYDAEGMNDNTVKKEACLLLQNEDVAKRVAELRNEAKEALQITREMIASKMFDIMTKTQDEKTAIKAGESLSKLLGLNEPDKIDVGGTGFSINIVNPNQAPTD